MISAFLQLCCSDLNHAVYTGFCLRHGHLISGVFEIYRQSPTSNVKFELELSSDCLFR